MPAPSMSPAVGSSTGPLWLTFDGVEDAGDENLGAASPNGPIVCCGTPINMDDMEVVGTGTRNNPDGDASVSVEVYRPKAGATTDVYTKELGGTDTGPATWFRWMDLSRPQTS